MDSSFLPRVFSDETGLFRLPAEPEAGDQVVIRLRTQRGSAQRATLVTLAPRVGIPMTCIPGEDYDTFEAGFPCPDKTVYYYFLVESTHVRYIYEKNGLRPLGPDDHPDPAFFFRITPGFHVPGWSRGAVQYQIFTDRFRNGDPTNDVQDREYYYVNGHSHHKAWTEPVREPDIGCFYGGDLQGVEEKLDYLQELGVEVIYFNPIFVSPSSHKYDTQDYDHVDPHFAAIVEDKEHRMQDWEKHNGFAPQYICRVANRANLEATDRYFAEFCRKVHARGMRIILDGVFNHCGSFHKWMDKEGIYLGKPDFAKGAFQDKESPYRSYFRFGEGGNSNAYEGWWGHDTLPKLNYEDSPALQEAVLQIAEKWVRPPYSIDGWRLDVAADLGHSSEFNHRFWKEFRRRVKRANPETIILAEHYGDASSWLQGDEWDTVMNYDAFMEPVTFFLTGMEKHSDGFSPDLYQNGTAFFDIMRNNMAKFQEPSLYCAMNELSNHDHSRFLTRTNRRVGRLASAGTEAASLGIDKAVMREAVAIQMTWPGSPTIYYGDEAGLCGWTDPDNRRTYPWGSEDKELIACHRDLIALRKKYPVLSSGSVLELGAGRGFIAYARFDGAGCALIAVNNGDQPRQEKLDLTLTGVPGGSRFANVFESDEKGHRLPREKTIPVSDGSIDLTMAPKSVTVLVLQ